MLGAGRIAIIVTYLGAEHGGSLVAPAVLAGAAPSYEYDSK